MSSVLPNFPAAAYSPAVFFPRRVLVFMGVFSLMVFAMVAISHRPAPPPAPALPPGKVAPYLWDDMLLAPDGTLWSLSHSGDGGPTSLSLTPLASGNDWKQVSGVAGRGVGIKQDGTLWLWQSAHSPFSSTPSTPVQIGLERDWAYASHSWNYAPLLKTDGSLWYLGDEYIDSKTPPTSLKPAMRPSRLGTDRDWAAIANSNGVHYALKKDGTLWHWGSAAHRDPFEIMPQLLSPDRDWRAISRCSHGLAALKKDGSLWISGQNAHMVAADYTGGSAVTPVRVGPEAHWQEIIGGENNLIARHPDGSWWALGENRYARLGFPASKHLGKPTRLSLDLQLWAWSSGKETTLLLTRDGSIYFMGRTPGSGRAALTGLAGIKNVINRELGRMGIPPPFARLGETWSQRPVKIGELPPSVISALKSGQ